MRKLLLFLAIFTMPCVANAVPVIATEAFVRSAWAQTIAAAQKGVANGVATLDENGKVPAAQLPDMATGNFLPISGGVMTGAITLHGAPTAELHPVTKKYVDDIASKSAGGLNGTAPSWAALRAENWDSGRRGMSWEVHSVNRANKAEGIGVCLGDYSPNMVMSQADIVNGIPKTTGWGKNCFCQITRINNQSVVGRFIYDHTFEDTVECYSRCAGHCSYCASNGRDGQCTRDALFAAP